VDGYPIPEIRLDKGAGELLLDVGSGWGRWSVSAGRKGWKVIGIDLSLVAIMAARRAFSNMGLEMSFVCGDARFLTFKENVFRCVFSYSVLQHFSETDAEIAIAIGRVLRRMVALKFKWLL
jgi:ubiquinone/menaquinone biosynthesis C-methylase UbiE